MRPTATAWLRRNRPRQAGLGIRRPGHLAGQRDPDPGSIVSRSGCCENAFDELKNQWGWGGFTMQDHRVKPGGMPDALPLVSGQCGADLQLVEPVCSSG